jgi:hypothetical protein
MDEKVSSDSEVEKTSKISKPKFAGKYNKFKYFAHWFIDEMKSKDIISQEQGKAMLSELCFYGSVEEQNAVYSAFIETNPKFSVTAINKNIREEINLTKPKKTKDVDPEAPLKKRGRKKKQVEDSSSEEEKLLSAIVDAKNAVWDEPIVEQELTEEPIVEPELNEEPIVESELNEEPIVEPELNEEPIVEPELNEEPVIALSTPMSSELVEETNQATLEVLATPVIPTKTVKKRVSKKKQVVVTDDQLALIDRELVGEDFIEIELGGVDYQINAEHVIFDLDDKEVGRIENKVLVLN